MLGTHLHMNLSSVFPFSVCFFFFVLQSSAVQSHLVVSCWLPPSPADHPAPYIPATTLCPAIDMDFFLPLVTTASFSTSNFKVSFASLLLQPYSRGMGQRLVLGRYLGYVPHPPHLNQDSFFF